MYWTLKDWESELGDTTDKFAYRIADCCQQGNLLLPDPSELVLVADDGEVEATPEQIASFKASLYDWYEYFTDNAAGEAAYREECRGLIYDRL